jgi:Zn-dependent protease
LIPLEVLIPLFAVLILSLSFHEAAHAWTADKLGDPTARQLGRLTLNPLAHIDWIGTVLFPLLAMVSGFPLIGWAKPVPVYPHHLRHPRRDFALVALAGPVSNLILAVGLAGIVTVLLGGDRMTDTAGQLTIWLVRAVQLNVLLAVFNMLPVPTLDGANVLAGVLPEAGARVIDRMRPYGILILYALLFTGIFRTVIFPIEDAIVGWLL